MTSLSSSSCMYNSCILIYKNRQGKCSRNKLMKKIEIKTVLITLRKLMRATDLYSRKLVKTSGLTTPQLLLLQSIRSKGEVSISELSGDVSLSQATVTNILDRLEAKGLVIRQRSSKDRRKVHAYLTEDGKNLIKKIPATSTKKFY